MVIELKFAIITPIRHLGCLFIMCLFLNSNAFAISTQTEATNQTNRQDYIGQLGSILAPYGDAKDQPLGHGVRDILAINADCQVQISYPQYIGNADQIYLKLLTPCLFQAWHNIITDFAEYHSSLKRRMYTIYLPMSVEDFPELVPNYVRLSLIKRGACDHEEYAAFDYTEDCVFIDTEVLEGVIQPFMMRGYGHAILDKKSKNEFFSLSDWLVKYPHINVQGIDGVDEELLIKSGAEMSLRIAWCLKADGGMIPTIGGSYCASRKKP